MALSSLFVEIGGSIAGLRAAMGEAVTEIKAVERSTGEAATGLERSSKIGSAAGLFLAGGLVIAGGEAIKMAANFETSNNKLVSTAGESSNVLKDVVGPGILKMAGDVGYSAQQLSEGMYTVESGGFHAQAGLDLMKSAAQGAKAENADLGTTTNALTTVMQDYKKSITDPAVAMSQLVAITGTGKMSFQDLAGSLSSVLPQASLLGIGLGQVGGAIATMTQHGESADLATQHLNHTIGALNQPLGPARAGMQQFGINVQDLTLGMGDDKRGLVGTIGLIQDAIVKKMGPAGTIAVDMLKKSQQGAKDAADMLKTMPPALAKASSAFQDGSMSAKDYTKYIRGLGAPGVTMGQQFAGLVKSSSGFSDALKSGKPEVVNYAAALRTVTGDQTTADTIMQLSGKNFEEYSQNVQTANGATKDASGAVKGFADTQDTLNFKLDSAKASAGAFAISLGNALLPAAKVVADVLQSVAHWMAENSWAAAGLAVIIGVVVTGAIAKFVTSSVKGLADVAVSLVKGVAGFATWVFGRLFGYSSVATAAEVEAGAEEGSMVKRSSGLVVNIAKGAWWVATKIGHFVAVSAAAAIHAGIAVAKWVWEVTTSIASAAASGAIWVATKIGQYVAIGAAAVVQAGIASAAWIAENIVAIAATGGIILVIGLLVAAILWCIDHWEDIKRVVGVVWDWIVNAVKVAADWLVNLFLNWTLPGIIINHWQDIVDFVKKAWQWIVDAVKGAIKWVVDLVTGWPGQILSALGNFGSLLFDSGKNMVIGLWNGLVSMGTWLWDKVTGWIKSVIPGPIAAALGIASPSKVAHDLAAFVPQGLAGGMIANAQIVTDASKHLAARAVSAFSGPGSTIAVDASAGGYALSQAAVSGASAIGGGSTGVGGGAAGGPNITIVVQGTVVDAQGIFDIVQRETTRYNGRNPTNGLSTTGRL